MVRKTIFFFKLKLKSALIIILVSHTYFKCDEDTIYFMYVRESPQLIIFFAFK